MPLLILEDHVLSLIVADRLLTGHTRLRVQLHVTSDAIHLTLVVLCELLAGQLLLTFCAQETFFVVRICLVGHTGLFDWLENDEKRKRERIAVIQLVWRLSHEKEGVMQIIAKARNCAIKNLE